MTRELRDTRCDLCGMRRHGLVTMELAHDWHPCLVRVCSSCRYYEAAHLAPVGRGMVSTPYKGNA